MNIILSGSANQLLASIKTLQVMVHLTLLHVHKPVITAKFFEELFKMISFDPVDNIEVYIRAFFNIPEEGDGDDDDDEESHGEAEEGEEHADELEVDSELVDDESHEEEHDDIRDSLNELGYDSSYFIVGLGSLLIMTCLQLLLLPI